MVACAAKVQSSPSFWQPWSGGGVACGAGPAAGIGGLLELVPDTALEVEVFDVQEILSGDAPAGLERSLEGSLDLEEIEESGILMADVDMVVLADTNSGGELLFLEGGFDFGDVRDVLDEAGREDEDYRGYELWEGDPALALIEDDGYIIMGDSGEVKDVLKSLSRDQGFLLQDDEDPLKRVMDRAGTGLVAWSNRDCGAIDLSGCEATGVAASAGDKFVVEMVHAYVFSSERAADGAVRNIDDFYEARGDGVDSLVYEVYSDGEFVVVEATADEDELFYE